jgi:hypothetical protein
MNSAKIYFDLFIVQIVSLSSSRWWQKLLKSCDANDDDSSNTKSYVSDFCIFHRLWHKVHILMNFL